MTRVTISKNSNNKNNKCTIAAKNSNQKFTSIATTRTATTSSTEIWVWLKCISGEAYTDYVATRWYRAPELLVGDPQYGKWVGYRTYSYCVAAAAAVVVIIVAAAVVLLLLLLFLQLLFICFFAAAVVLKRLLLLLLLRLLLLFVVAVVLAAAVVAIVVVLSSFILSIYLQFKNRLLNFAPQGGGRVGRGLSLLRDAMRRPPLPGRVGHRPAVPDHADAGWADDNVYGEQIACLVDALITWFLRSFQIKKILQFWKSPMSLK